MWWSGWSGGAGGAGGEGPGVPLALESKWLVRAAAAAEALGAVIPRIVAERAVVSTCSHTSGYFPGRPPTQRPQQPSGAPEARTFTSWVTGDDPSQSIGVGYQRNVPSPYYNYRVHGYTRASSSVRGAGVCVQYSVALYIARAMSFAALTSAMIIQVLRRL